MTCEKSSEKLRMKSKGWGINSNEDKGTASQEHSVDRVG